MLPLPKECGERGNLFTNYEANPYVEFNIFGDPFAAYQVSLKLRGELLIINKLKCVSYHQRGPQTSVSGINVLFIYIIHKTYM